MSEVAFRIVFPARGPMKTIGVYFSPMIFSYPFNALSLPVKRRFTVHVNIANDGVLVCRQTWRLIKKNYKYINRYKKKKIDIFFSTLNSILIRTIFGYSANYI